MNRARTTSKTVIVDRHPAGVTLRGAAAELWRSTAHEVLIAGPAETGKTFAGLLKHDALLLAIPGAQAVLIRKVRDSAYSTVLQTYERKILHPAHPARPYGGQRPSWYDYPNGGRLWLAGFDDPGKALSSERDFIYVNQAEELTADDWEVLSTRCTGRAGATPHPQLFGDCNPGPAHHWILQRPTLTVLESRHEDNPALWDADRKDWTEQGRRTMAVLDALSGVRRERLRFGRWVSAEGVVYEGFDARVHVVAPFPIPDGWTRLRSIDFGYTNPFVCQWWALDHDGRMYLYRELYMSGRTVRQHAEQVKQIERWYLPDGKTLSPTREQVGYAAADHDAEDRATLDECGIPTAPADKAISPGVQAVESRLAVAADGKPRLFLFANALVERDEVLAEAHLPVCTRQEFDTYVWPKGADGKPVKESPVDLNNHGMDALRYAVRWADQFLAGGGTGPRGFRLGSGRVTGRNPAESWTVWRDRL
jgi:phage terminase large subunit